MVRVLADAVGRRVTTVDRLRDEVAARSRVRRRAWLLRVLADIEAGACSVLEHGYLVRVERAHGLPRASRQVARRGASGSEYRDVEYDEFGLVVELDGRAAHAGWEASGRDTERDLDDLASGREVVRLRHPQVLGRPCRTALRIAEILARRGWRGEPTRCGPGCAISA